MLAFSVVDLLRFARGLLYASRGIDSGRFTPGVDAVKRGALIAGLLY